MSSFYFFFIDCFNPSFSLRFCHSSSALFSSRSPTRPHSPKTEPKNSVDPGVCVWGNGYSELRDLRGLRRFRRFRRFRNSGGGGGGGRGEGEGEVGKDVNLVGERRLGKESSLSGPPCHIRLCLLFNFSLRPSAIKKHPHQFLSSPFLSFYPVLSSLPLIRSSQSIELCISISSPCLLPRFRASSRHSHSRNLLSFIPLSHTPFLFSRPSLLTTHIPHQ